MGETATCFSKSLLEARILEFALISSLIFSGWKAARASFTFLSASVSRFVRILFYPKRPPAAKTVTMTTTVAMTEKMFVS